MDMLCWGTQLFSSSIRRQRMPSPLYPSRQVPQEPVSHQQGYAPAASR